jgi:hypothetical protein
MSPTAPPTIAARTRSRSGARSGVVRFPVRQHFDRLRRSFGDLLIDELILELEEMNLLDRILDPNDRPPAAAEVYDTDLIECVYDTRSQSMHPVVTGERGGKYFYCINGTRQYLKGKHTEMVDPETTPIVDLDPALRITEVTVKK